MLTPEALARKNQFAARIAWLHEPVQLTSPLVPWFLLRYLEQSLHGCLCSLEQCLLIVFEKMLLGQLPAQQPKTSPSLDASPESIAPAPDGFRRGGRLASVGKSADAMSGEVAVEEDDAALLGEWQWVCWGAVHGGCNVGASSAVASVRADPAQRAYWRGAAWSADRCRWMTNFSAAWVRRENCA